VPGARRTSGRCWDLAGVGREVGMIRRVAGCTMAMCAALLVGGCGLFEGRWGGSGASGGNSANTATQSNIDANLPLPQSQPPISDIPVPINFKLDEANSRNYAVPGARFVDHIYTGRGDKFVLKRFFERYMVMNRWVLATFSFGQGRIVLDFEKDYEHCRITIWEGGFLRPTSVSVFLSPSKPPAGKGDTPRS